MIDVVIGAAYGDEGKGHTVSQLVSEDSVVVRFNGGSQAGHTVVRDGVRRVFSHFGAGTMEGATTFLSRFFVCNPIMFLNEYEGLARFHPKVMVSPNCMVTTPYDVAINIMLEQSRGDKRHGSVGVGFGETIERNERGVCFEAADDASVVRRIANEWFPARCKELGLTEEVNPGLWAMATSPQTEYRFMDDFKTFRDMTTFTFDSALMETSKHLVFEGAQGLLLDQHEGVFPHVTRSNTGLANVVSLLGPGHSSEVNVYYVTRGYTTRHGSGPLPWELPEAPYGVNDATNVKNQYQGHLRFSYLNMDSVQKAIMTDSCKNFRPWMKFQGVMTCMDQLADSVTFIQEGKMRECSKNWLPLTLSFLPSVYMTGGVDAPLERFQ
jgi:adenylosuccinate synthase